MELLRNTRPPAAFHVGPFTTRSPSRHRPRHRALRGTARPRVRSRPSSCAPARTRRRHTGAEMEGDMSSRRKSTLALNLTGTPRKTARKWWAVAAHGCSPRAPVRSGARATLRPEGPPSTGRVVPPPRPAYRVARQGRGLRPRRRESRDDLARREERTKNANGREVGPCPGTTLSVFRPKWVALMQFPCQNNNAPVSRGC